MSISIPVIDLSPFRKGTSDHKKKVAEAVALAWEKIGFLVIEGHGIDPAEGSQLYNSAIIFFDRSLDEKLVVRRHRNDQNRGYIAYGEETLARMHGGNTPLDYKEVFAIGPDDVPSTEY